MALKTLVIGNGSCAFDIVDNLLSKNVEVIIATRDNSLHQKFSEIMGQNITEIHTETTIHSCTGAIGNFTISMKNNNKSIIRIVDCIVIAEDSFRKTLFASYGLSPSTKTISLSDLDNPENYKNIADENKSFVLLKGLKFESNPVISKEVMDSSIKLASHGQSKIYILTKNLKVAGNRLEALYRKAKKAGIIFIKFTDSEPEFFQGEDGKTCIEFTDEVTKKNFSLTPDITVVDESIVPSDYLETLAKTFGLNIDCSGFLQSDNVHRLPAYTNRKGIFVAGPSRGISSPEDYKAEAGTAAIAVLNNSDKNNYDIKDKAYINKGGCVRCLTCYRICPHKTISLNSTLSVMPEGCEGCGLCTAECPKNAITIENLDHKFLIPDDKIQNADSASKPRITAFCCSRSAAEAYKLAVSIGLTLPEGLKIVEVPCAGSISLTHILNSLKNSTGGTIILTCHEGNCFSEKGNVFAHNRAKSVSKMISDAGYKKERLMTYTIASNMGKEFSNILNDFEKNIIDLE
ncbi:MAG: hydrogenase iron-sulfur subunit [Desulfobacterales bacterium]|nr:hydrogenase iron-sulfur subunit [Desulfobacteraceae bacterium]MBT4364816.1 hydrogenase iron-sulfur subunit [Desulfobacteraceae bacterium]MBT7085171.1 hydrogenase iron-sulfur subunit [Desulfobacterales bacterium]MBT7696389.1 hydrogenase iron-sulfur subunit [Desulfobacterales bacterium]